MNLVLKRTIYGHEGIGGLMYFKNNHICDTLENKKLAIPKGKYNIIITHSKKFNKELPELLNVPNRTGIRIHAGNKPSDSQGCILVGKFVGIETLENSKNTLEKVISTIKENNIKEIEII